MRCEIWPTGWREQALASARSPTETPGRGNGVEVYAATPFHVTQPQVRPVDLFLDDDDLMVWTTETFGDQAGFQPIERYQTERAEHLAPDV